MKKQKSLAGIPVVELENGKTVVVLSPRSESCFCATSKDGFLHYTCRKTINKEYLKALLGAAGFENQEITFAEIDPAIDKVIVACEKGGKPSAFWVEDQVAENSGTIYLDVSMLTPEYYAELVKNEEQKNKKKSETPPEGPTGMGG